MSFGRPYILKTDGCIHDGWLVIGETDKVFYQDFLYYMLSSTFMYKSMSGLAAGSTVKNLKSESVKSLLIPIPSINEQKRISNKLEECIKLLDIINISKQEIIKIKDSIKERILCLAIQGKLVEQDPNDEPASILLEKIREKRETILGKKFVDSYIYKADDNCYYENNLETNIEIPFELPLNWAFTRLHNIAWLEDGEKIHNKELPYLDARTLRGKQPPLMITKGELVNKGTNVILVDGENSGEVFEVPYNGYMGSTFKVLKVSKHIEKGYIKIILDFYRNLFRENKTGSAIPHLNKKLFKNLIVALPSATEQIKILEKINNILSILKDEG